MKRQFLLSILSMMLAMMSATVWAQVPTITTLSPLSAKPGDAVTITGTGFNTTAANNVVFMGATRATVTSASATSLTVTVPTGATYAPVTVLNTGTSLAAASNQRFNPIFAPAKSGITTADFTPKVDYATGTQPYSVAIGDIDGDGKPDLAVANQGAGNVSVLRGNGNGTFATAVNFTTVTQPTSVAIGDIDGDGKPDLAVANYSSGNVSVLRNTGSSGSINFATKVDFATGTQPYSVAIGDIDGDGKPDLAVANYGLGANSVSVLRNTGTSGSTSFAAKVDFTTGTRPTSVAIGDIDGDGKADLATANFGSGNVSVLRNTGASGSISFAAKVDFTTGTQPTSVAIGDIDGDGKADLAVANQGSNTVSVLRNTGSSGSISFATKVDFATGTQPVSVAIGDIDGDGKPDLATANYGAGVNTVSVLRNTGSSGSISFATKVDFATGTGPTSVAIGDLNGDGLPDLVAANFWGNSASVLLQAVPPPPSPTITNISPLSAKPGDAVTITGTGFNTTAANNVVFMGATRATVTSASATSLTVTVPTGATYAPVTVLNTGTSLAAASNQRFSPIFAPAKSGITTADFAPKVDYVTGANPYFVAIGDLDGDGIPDLATANQGTSNVSVLRGNGNGTFAAAVNFATGNFPRSVAIGDLNGDGKPDLAVANMTSNNVSVLRNTGNSGSIAFAAAVNFTTGTFPFSVAIGDLDGDGKADLAVANFNSNSVSVLRNTGSSGSISFATAISFAAGTGPTSVAIGDLDGDGKADLAVANSSSNNVSVLRNTSTSGNITTGSFAVAVNFAAGTGSISIAIGDIDGDGKADLAVANQTANNVSVLRNTSTSGNITTGSFAAAVNFATGINPTSVAIGDIEGDGKPDLAVANSSSSNASVLRNTGSSGSIDFAAGVNFATGLLPISLAIGDLNGDGLPDLATANTNSSNASVLLQVVPPPPSTITNISPLSAKPGDAVTITGTGFNITAANNVVFMGATRATVTAASATSLTVTVPAGATYAPVTVLNTGTGLAAASNQRFIPVFAPAKSGITTADFTAAVNFTTGTNPRSVAIGDLDGDGIPDLAVANQGAGNVSVLRGNGNGTFAAAVNFLVGASNPTSVAIGDIDGDGKADLATSNFLSGNVSVLRNTGASGSISFAAAVNFTTGTQPFSVAIGDIDGDGKPDLAVANYNADNVFVLRNTGTSGSISFAAAVNFATGINPTSVAIGDIDGDGKADLATANYGSGNVSVLRNTGTSGSISFAAAVNFATGTQPISVGIGDLDGDGKPDLATANYGAGINTVSVLRNTGSSGSITTGSFATKVDFITGTRPFSVAIGDLNGDGMPDLVAANYDGGNASVLLQVIPPNITITGTLSAFSTTYGTASANQTFTVSGTDLTTDITLTAPAGFEISTNASTGFGTTVTLTRTGSTVAATTIFVRLRANVAVAGSPYSGNITAASTGATTRNVAIPASTVSAKALTVTGATAQNKVYDRTATATITGATLNGVITGDVVTVSGGGTFAAVNVGTGIAVTANLTLGGAQAGNYTLTQPTGLTANITARALTVTGATAQNKVYDRTAAATITGATLNGVITGDVVTVSGGGTFAAVNVGTGIAVTANLTLGGAQAGNYTLTQPTGLQANITAATLTVTGATAQNKVYDRTAAATITGATLNGVITGDVVTVSGGGTFADANVGTGIAVTANLTLGGAQAGNYTLTQPTGLTANITARALTVTGATAQNKVYDRTAAATITGATLNGVITGDVVTVSGGGTFADANVGTGIAVTANLTLGGAQAGNYTLTQPMGLSANITARALTVTGAIAQNKVYDRTATATITGATLSGVITGDDVTVSGGGTFADANVGTGKAVTAALILGGAQAGNYTLTQPTGLTADITRKPLTITGLTARNKTFNGNTNATLNGTPALAGVINPDDVTLTGTAVGTFATPAVGTGKPVNVTGLSITGVHAGNYELQALVLTANIVAPGPPPPPPPSGLNLTTQPVLQNTVFNPQSGLINPQMQLQNGSAAQRTVSGPIEPVFERGQLQGYRITGAGTVCFTFFGEANTNSRAQVCFNVAPVACGAIEFAALTNVPWNTNGQPLNATAACGTVNFRVVSGLADIVENIVRPFPRSSGTVTVEASVSPASLDVNRDGVADFIASAPIQRTFRVLPIAQTITFNNLSVPRADVGIRLPLSAFASSGLPVTLTVVSGNGRIEGRELVITGGGEIIVEATQSGNEAWLPATPVRRSIEGVVPPRIRQSQVLTFNLPPNNLQNGFALSATASSNLPVSFTVVEGGAFARIDNNSLVIVNRPTTATRITIEATQGGNDDFNPAAPVRRSFQLLPSIQSGGPTVLLSTGTLCQGSSIRAQLAGNFGADAALRLIVSDNQGNFNGGEGFIDARLEGNNTLVSYQTSNLATGTYRVRIDVATADGTIIGTPSAASFQLVAGNQLLGIEEGVSATGTRTLRSPIATGNSWTRDGQAVGNGQMIEATQPGWYVLTVQAGNCTFTATTFVSANGRTEAEETAATTSEGRNGFRVYPNPGKGVFTLQGRQSVDGEAEVIISDMQGRVISRQSISGRQMNETIDLKEVSTGVYLLQIRQADGKVWTEKLVKE